MAALERPTVKFGAPPATHVPLQLVDRRYLRPPDDVERHRLVRVAAEAANLKISVPRIECVTEGRRRLRRTLVAEHTHVPGLARELVGFLARLCTRSADIRIEFPYRYSRDLVVMTGYQIGELAPPQWVNPCV